MSLLTVSVVIVVVVLLVCLTVDWEDHLGHYGEMFGLLLFGLTFAVLFWVNVLYRLYLHFWH